MNQPKDRAALADVCNAHGVKNAVEVGTDRAAFAVAFLERFAGWKLFCIDPWTEYDHMPFDREADYLTAVMRLAPFVDRVRIIRATSEGGRDALRSMGIRPEFVYIDGDHKRDAVANDLTMWWELLAPRGILAGHDYLPRGNRVRDTVDAFAASNRLAIHTTRDSPPSWYTFKGA